MGLQHGFLFLLICICSVSTKAEVVEDKLLNIINQANQLPTINLFGGLSLRKIDGQRSFNSEKTDILQSAEEFLATHELQFSFPTEEQLLSGNYILRQKIPCGLVE